MVLVWAPTEADPEGIWVQVVYLEGVGKSAGEWGSEAGKEAAEKGYVVKQQHKRQLDLTLGGKLENTQLRIARCTRGVQEWGHLHPNPRQVIVDRC